MSGRKTLAHRNGSGNCMHPAREEGITVSFLGRCMSVRQPYGYAVSWHTRLRLPSADAPLVTQAALAVDGDEVGRAKVRDAPGIDLVAELGIGGCRDRGDDDAVFELPATARTHIVAESPLERLLPFGDGAERSVGVERVIVHRVIVLVGPGSDQAVAHLIRPRRGLGQWGRRLGGQRVCR